MSMSFPPSAGHPCSWASGLCPARPTAFWPTWATSSPARAICTAHLPWRQAVPAALGKNPPFFGEFTVRHPEDKNVELLWHCGPFAYSLKKPGTVAREENQRQWFQVKDGKFTICRFDQDDGHYQLLNGTLESADGPYTFGTYLWARFNNLTKWERKLIDGPYIHHMAEVEGDYTWELREFCRLIPHLDSDTVD